VNLRFALLPVVSLLLAACSFGDEGTAPPQGPGGTAGGGAGGTGGSGGADGGAGSSGVGGGGGSGGSSAVCEGPGPECATHCAAPDSVEGVCDNGAWACPAGTIDRSVSCLSAGCCMTTAECPTATTCIVNRCMENVAAPYCWTDADCPAGSCQGAILCACGEMCILPDEPGTCGP